MKANYFLDHCFSEIRCVSTSAESFGKTIYEIIVAKVTLNDLFTEIRSLCIKLKLLGEKNITY